MSLESVKMIKTVELPVVRDTRGFLSFGEINHNIPFPIKRFYFMGDLPQNGDRGHHAHRKTRQILFCINGSALINFDDGSSRDKIHLTKPNIGVIIEPMVWHSMENFESNTLILVIASEKYQESDYIRNYQEFLELSIKH